MNWIVANIKWIMLVSGVLTGTMLYAAIAPQAALRSTFGETLEGPLAEILVRNWGALIFLVGGMLIYGAYDPPGRPLILIVAGLSKLVFIGLVLAHGRQYLGHQAGLAVLIDLVVVALFVVYLVGVRRSHAVEQPDAGIREMAVAPSGRRGVRIDRVVWLVLCTMAPSLQSSGEEDWHGSIRWAGCSRADVHAGGHGADGQAAHVEGGGDERSGTPGGDPRDPRTRSPLPGRKGLRAAGCTRSWSLRYRRSW
jgi:hypothetical protein